MTLSDIIRIWIRLMFLAWLGTLLLGSTAWAWTPDRIVGLEEISFTGARLGARSRDPLAPQYTGSWTHRAALQFRFNILDSLYWDNRAHTEVAASAVRTVGWWWTLGLRVHPQLDLFWEHHSRHIVDEQVPGREMYPTQQSRNFPVEDSYGLKLNVYLGERGRSILE
jgi:hypothetical protein